MAYMNQERKAELVALAKPILKKYGVKATFAVYHHSTIVCNISSGKLDFIRNLKDTTNVEVSDYIQVNEHHVDKHYSGDVKEFLMELVKALNTGNHNNSRIEVDYFDVGWYVTINVGKWNKPYKLVA